MTLWEFATSLYGRPGVEDTCLSLQDVGGQNIPLLIWRLWALDRGVEEQGLHEAISIARDWEATVVAPLRALRRRLCNPVNGIPDQDRLALRESIKADELMAERVLLDSLEKLAHPGVGEAANAFSALCDLAGRWGGAAEEPLIARLAAAAASATA